jgi:hypothetical protein
MTTRDVIETHWRSANARDWARFELLLDARDFFYDVPQTRECVRSAAAYLEMFRTWPGDWLATVRLLVCEADKAVCVIDFTVGGEVMTGISIFELTDGRIRRVTDYWPSPYEPPPRATPLMVRY